MRPRSSYRLAVVLIPLGVVLVVAGAVLGNWLGLASGVLAILNGVINLVSLRRRGIGWNGPKTFRELRAMEAERREQT